MRKKADNLLSAIGSTSVEAIQGERNNVVIKNFNYQYNLNKETGIFKC